MATPAKLSKSDALSHWEGLDDTTPLRMSPIEAGQTGSTYAEDTIRLTGSQEFIDGCLSRLKGLLEYENETESRLEILYTEVTERVRNDDGKLVPGELTGTWAAYIKAKSRGGGRGHRGGRKLGSKNKPKEGMEPKPDKVPGKRGRPPKAVVANGEATPVKRQPTIAAYTEAMYAIARGSMESTGRDTPDWLEPIEDHPVFKMKTHEDVASMDNAIDDAIDKHKLKRVKPGSLAEKNEIQKVEITVKDDGTLIFEEF